MMTAKTKTMELIHLKEVKDGKETFETRRYRNLKTDSAEADIMAVADTISSLSDSPAREVTVTVQSSINAEV